MRQSVSWTGLAPPVRTVAASAIVTALLGGGLVACGGSAGTEVGEVTTADLHEVQDDLALLEDRMGRLEDVEHAAGETAEGDEARLVGLEVTVTGEVAEVASVGAVGVVVRLSAGPRPSLAVLADAPREGIGPRDIVRVTGPALWVDRDSFEHDFGVAAGGLFEEPPQFFGDLEGQLAIAGTRVEIVWTSRDE